MEFSVGNTSVYFVRSTYQATNGIYLGLRVADDDPECPGEHWSDVTVCLPELELKKNEVVIPVYKLTEETYQVIKEALVAKEVRKVQHGFATSLIVKLKEDWMEYTQEY